MEEPMLRVKVTGLIDVGRKSMSPTLVVEGEMSVNEFAKLVMVLKGALGPEYHLLEQRIKGDETYAKAVADARMTLRVKGSEG